MEEVQEAALEAVLVEVLAAEVARTEVALAEVLAVYHLVGVQEDHLEALTEDQDTIHIMMITIITDLAEEVQLHFICSVDQ
jgi:hypothetical protein